MIYAWGGGAVFPGRKLAGGKETTVRDGKAGSQRPSFPGGQPGQFPRQGLSQGALISSSHPAERGYTPAAHPSFPGGQPGQLLGHGLSWGALDFRLPPSRERGYTPSSLSLFGLFYKYLLSTSLPPRPPGSSPAPASGLRTRLGAKPGSAPDLTGQSLVGRHTANRK